MLFFISPAKNMKKTAGKIEKCTKPVFLNKTEILWDYLKNKEPWQLESILKVKPELALKCFGLFQDIHLQKEGTPALFAYDGLQYKNIKPEDFSEKELLYAQEHLRILSGFYGVLRPLDGIFPYRLEMQSKVKIDGKNLYDYWSETLYENLFQTGEPVINLASEEYAKAIKKYKKEEDTMVTCDFLCCKKGGLKMVATLSKMARGQMVQFLIKKQCKNVEEIKAFCWNDFEYQEELSFPDKFVFVQNYGLEDLSFLRENF